MATYQLVTGFNGVQRTSDNAFIPNAAGNGDWQAYQVWLVEGNTPDPAPGPSPTDMLNAKIAAGIQITSTGAPALNGTYPIDQGTLNNLGNLLAAIGAGVGLPGGGTTVPLADVTGTPHTFTAAQVESLDGAISTYIYNLRITWNLLNAQQQASWPSQPVTIP